MQQDQKSSQSSYSNQYYNTLSALQIRLDTTQILEKMYNYISGNMQIAGYDKENNPVLKEVCVGSPKANEDGVQSIMSWFQSLVNNAVVQGNFGEDQYKYFIWEKRREFVRFLVLNRPIWGIHPYEISGIVDIAMNLIEPFMSRTINNKERESYGDTIRTIESNTMHQRGAGLFR